MHSRSKARIQVSLLMLFFCLPDLDGMGWCVSRFLGAWCYYQALLDQSACVCHRQSAQKAGMWRHPALLCLYQCCAVASKEWFIGITATAECSILKVAPSVIAHIRNTMPHVKPPTLPAYLQHNAHIWNHISAHVDTPLNIFMASKQNKWGSYNELSAEPS